MAASKPTSRFNQPGGDRRGQRPLSARPASSLWYGLAVLLVLVLAQVYYLTPAGRQLPYSEFKSLVKDGSVTEVTIGDQVIRGTLKASSGSDPKQSAQFTTTGSPRSWAGSSPCCSLSGSGRSSSAGWAAPKGA
jgi:hypothetical protein